MEKISMKQRLLEILTDNERIASNELYEMLKFSPSSVRRRITDLRRDGHMITTEKINGDYYYRYDGHNSKKVIKPQNKINNIKEFILNYLNENDIIYRDYFCSIYHITIKTLTAVIGKLRNEGHHIMTFKNEDNEFYYTKFNKDVQSFEPKEKAFYYKKNKDGKPYFRYYFDEDIIKIIPLGDLHLSTEEQIPEIIDLFDLCRENGVYIALMGDLIENASKHSVADGWNNQRLTNQEQIERMSEIIYDYSDIILFMVAGNHEYRTAVHSGTDVTKLMSSFANIPYVNGRCFGFFENKYTSKMFHASHKCSGGVMKASKRKGIYYKTKEQFSADIFFAGHLHDSLSETEMFYLDLDKETLEMTRRFWVAMMSPSNLKYHNGYGDRNCYPIPNQNYYYLEIHPDGRMEKRLLKEELIVN
ncbi:MAG: winged helix-turn-helix domain-containing protein [Nanoarchaeota archaeon]